MKRILLAVLMVFVVWTALDFVINDMILPNGFAGAQLSRPGGETNPLLIHAAVLIAAASFVLLYALTGSDGGARTYLPFGFLYGVGAGLLAGFGSSLTTALPYTVVFWWSLGRLAEGIIAGILTGVIVKKQKKTHWAPFGMRERGDYIIKY